MERHHWAAGGASSHLWVFEVPKDTQIHRVSGVVARETPEETPKDSEIMRCAQDARLIRLGITHSFACNM